MFKVVKTQSKGMVTIPVEYRESLGVNENTLFEVKLIDNGVVFTKVNMKAEDEIYSGKQIQKWMRENKLDAGTVKKLRKLFKI
ncbi:MAG: AbrB/MazE/SpoVT family DNA-binding domain-containing protein [Candidatus Peregrinibacteria bacterium]|nr:AbrB/MazE/SpoVT family DNA-binding domain-containing protein [Candidatus Peregrinibacteria bacterium]